MRMMDYGAAYPYAQELIDNHRETAINILARVCATDSQIGSEIVRTTSTKSAQHTQQQPHSKHEALRSPSRGLTLQIGPRSPTESSSSHFSNSPPHVRSRPMQKQYSDASHAGSVSSRTSYSGSLEKVPKDYAVLLNLTESDLQKEMMLWEDEFDVHVPRLNDPGHYDPIPVSKFMTLTWVRHGHTTTRKTDFNLVPDRMLDTDILFGEGNPGKGNSGYPSDPRQHNMGAMHQSAPREDAFSAPLTSIHHSDMSSRAQHQSGSHEVRQFTDRGFSHDAIPEPVRRSEASPAVTIRDVRSPADRDSQLRHSPDTHPTPPTGTPNTAVTRLRLRIKWDVTIVNVWLELDHSGEAFFQAFQQQLKGRREIYDRSKTTIRLKTDQESRNDAAYDLGLGEDELECDWDATLDWLKENKKEKPPHIFGVIEDHQNG